MSGAPAGLPQGGAGTQGEAGTQATVGGTIDVEFDGFVWYRVRVEPKAPMELSAATLRFHAGARVSIAGSFSFVTSPRPRRLPGSNAGTTQAT